MTTPIHREPPHRTYWNIKCDECDQHPMRVFTGGNWSIFHCLCEDKKGLPKAHRKNLDFYWPMSKYTFKVVA